MLLIVVWYGMLTPKVSRVLCSVVCICQGICAILCFVTAVTFRSSRLVWRMVWMTPGTHNEPIRHNLVVMGVLVPD